MAIGQKKQKQETIDQKTFENLCALQCTENEICGWFDCNTDTLCSWCKNTYGMNFSDTYALKRGKGKISLRRTQWQLAEKNPSMAIFLGKQYLGQKDIVQEEHKIDNGVLNDLIGALNNAKKSE